MEDKVVIKICAWDKLPCRNCKYSCINGASSLNCIMYQIKPDKVYYEGKNCEHFVRKVGK